MERLSDVAVHSRLVKVGGVKRLRVSSHVSVEHVAVVQSQRLPRLLVLGQVPARSQFGFQSLEVENHSDRVNGRKRRGELRGRDQDTHPNFPQ